MADQAIEPSAFVRDALSLAATWRDGLDLDALVTDQVGNLGEGGVDVVALGKAAPELFAAASRALGRRVTRRFLATDEPVAADLADATAIGEHPVPGPGSAEAGRRLLAFLDESSDATSTLFLVSGGTSSICVAPVAPLTLDALRDVWDRALTQGWDVTHLNRVRAAASALGGGAVLRRVRTRRSRSLVMVDNVGGGARWVASGLTYEFRPSAWTRHRLVNNLGDLDQSTRSQLRAATQHRARLMRTPVTTSHENRTLVEPAMALERVLAMARRRGMINDSMGLVNGDIASEVDRWARRVRSAPPGPTCLAGIGEVTIRLEGEGRGGRCQEFALRMSTVLSELGRPAACVALATDGRDFLPGVGGAWTDESTASNLERRGAHAGELAKRHESHDALVSLGQLVEGARTGWNLGDLYVVVLGPRPSNGEAT